MTRSHRGAIEGQCLESLAPLDWHRAKVALIKA